VLQDAQVEQDAHPLQTSII